jgi:hypothetical protein
MRGARLFKAQQTMDFVLPIEETSMIVMQAEADEERLRNHTVFKDSNDSTSFHQFRYGFDKIIPKKILKDVHIARNDCDKIKGELERMDTDEDKETFLMKNFIIDSFLFR